MSFKLKQYIKKNFDELAIAGTMAMHFYDNSEKSYVLGIIICILLMTGVYYFMIWRRSSH